MDATGMISCLPSLSDEKGQVPLEVDPYPHGPVSLSDGPSRQRTEPGNMEISDAGILLGEPCLPWAVAGRGF
jgi:hypothetical protein